MYRRTLSSLALSIALAAGMSVGVGLIGSCSALGQVGTSVTYQGQLKNNGVAVNSPSDVRFSIWDAATAGTQIGTTDTKIAVPVSQGLFSTTFDCGVNPYTADAARWLQIEVRNPSNVGGFVLLGARQRLTAAPFSAATRGINVNSSGNGVVIGAGPFAGLFVARGPNFGGAFRSFDNPIGSGPAAGTQLVGALSGSNAGAQMRFSFSESAANFIDIGQNAAGDFVVEGNDAARMVVQNSGNVGIGTASPAANTKVHMEQPFILNGFSTNLLLRQPIASWGLGPEFANYRYIQTQAAAPDFDGGFRQFNVGPGGVSIGYPNTPGYGSTDAMYVNGNVGIGTNTPSHKLTVVGDTNTMRLIGPTGTFRWNSRLNLGDADFVRISENDDDFLDLQGANGIRAANTFSAPAKNFRIDHPSDPANMILNHGCIESDQYVNLYRGNAVIGSDGGVWIQLPSWMNDLNTDFSYQLTSVGAAQPNLFVAVEVNQNNQFRVAGGVPGAKVSWQITGVRHDAYVQANPLVVEEVKTGSAAGTYLSPNSFGVYTAEELAKMGGRK